MRWIVPVAALVAALVGGHRSTPAAHPLTMRGQILHKEIQRELSHLNASTSYYSHTTYMNESTGTRRADCSGFIDYAIERVLPDAYAKVPRSTSVRPLAGDWFKVLSDAFQTPSPIEGPRWREIAHVPELRPGDIVVWLKAANTTGDTTGHMGVVLATPTRGRYREWLVKIADSVISPHSNDSRGSRTGIGSGTIGLLVNAYDRPIGYYWRGGVSPTSFTTSVVMGRIE